MPRSERDREFASFYREHIRRLVAYLLYQGAPGHLAAELAQEAMTRAYQRWDTIKSPMAYVCKVAYTTFIRHVLDVAEEPVEEVPEPTALLPHPQEVEAWLQEQQIIAVLRALPPRQRQVLALTYDDRSPAEIAGLVDIEPAAVRANLMKARRNAAEQLHKNREGGS
jgi:RNA polymerase sigma-70 factor (ECF subfamily)